MDHIAKMASMPLYGENALKSLDTGTNGPIAIELDMLHSGLMPVRI